MINQFEGAGSVYTLPADFTEIIGLDVKPVRMTSKGSKGDAWYRALPLSKVVRVEPGVFYYTVAGATLTVVDGTGTAAAIKKCRGWYR